MQLSHRELVVQFINEVCEDFALQTQTAGLAVSYFDRYVSGVGATGLCKARVQLLAITCLMIAAKFVEIMMPGLDDLCEIAHNKYSKEELKSMELETLGVLRWELRAVTPHDALQQLAIVADLSSSEASTSLLQHAEFFVDMSYYEHKTLRFPPLVIASSSLLCAWAHLGRAEALALHLPLLSAHCRASVHDLTQCQRVLHAYFKKTFPQKAAEAAERLRHQAELAACRSGACDSPDTVMAASFTGAPASGGAVDAADEGGEGAEELPREILPQGGAAAAGGGRGAALEAPLFAHEAAAPRASGSRRHDAKGASPAVR